MPFILLEHLDPFIVICFRLHDIASEFIMKHLILVKRSLLFIAFMTLAGVLFPDLRRSFGSMAQFMLFFILFLSPLSKIFRCRLLLQLMGLRREFGIQMGCFAIVHGATYFMNPVTFSSNIEPYLNADFFSMQPLFYFGIIALILTLPLFFTSNDFSRRLLGGKRWKALHRIAYLLFLIVILHVFFVRGSRHGQKPLDILQPIGLISSYVFLKALARKNFIAPLRDAILYVNARYAKYALANNTENVSAIS